MSAQKQLPDWKTDDTCRTIPLCRDCFKLIRLMYCCWESKSSSENLSFRPTQQSWSNRLSRYFFRPLCHTITQRKTYRKQYTAKHFVAHKLISKALLFLYYYYFNFLYMLKKFKKISYCYYYVFTFLFIYLAVMIQNGHDFFSLCWHTHMWELVFYRLAAGHVGHNKWPNKGTPHRSFPGLKAVRFSSSVDDSMFKCFELPTRDLASWHSRPDKRQ